MTKSALHEVDADAVFMWLGDGEGGYFERLRQMREFAGAPLEPGRLIRQRCRPASTRTRRSCFTVTMLSRCSPSSPRDGLARAGLNWADFVCAGAW